MKVSTRPRAQVKGKPSGEASHRPYDIAAILLFAFAAVVVVALATPDSGLLGRTLGSVCETLFGRGAWAVPPFLGLIAVCLIKGQSLSFRHLGWGVTLIFLTILGFLAGHVNGNYFDPGILAPGGGYIGAGIAWLSATLLGAGKVIGIGALGLVGLVLTVDVPIRTMMEQTKQAAVTVKRKTIERPRTPKAPKPERKPIDRPLAERALPKGIIREDPDPEPEAIPVADEPRKTRKPPKITDTQQRSEPTLEVDSPEPKEGYELPPITLLAEAILNPKRSQSEMQKNIETLEGTLEQFGIEATVVEVATGPTVTRYEIQLGPGVRVNRITALADNIAMDLAASQVRVEAPIPGKAAIGVEVPNASPSMVTLRELCEDHAFKSHASRLAIGLGKDVSGNNRYADLCKMPHLLIGGATNSGKSIALATLITSLIMRNTPKDVRLVMIDPKRVELTLFDHIPHLMCPVIKDVKEAPGVLRAVWREMDRRYELLSNEGVRNIDGWNAKASFQDKMPYIVVIIDELADLMIQSGPEIETIIVRLAQLARAVGIHLVIATQRPSVDVITGLIKANIPSRMAFSTASAIDSRTILDQKGAETLIGKGDMLFLPIDANKPQRIQGCFVSEKEIDAICKFWRAQEPPEYVLSPVEDDVADSKKESGDFGEETDPLWEEAVRWVADRGQASTSMLQRKFSIGFQRASRLLDMMEERSIVGPRDGPRPRDVLVNHMDVDSLFGGGIKYDVGRTIDDEDVDY
jgi:S-DNA-T family DNA segregation ATPase FtsK/SpoIIIE